MVCKYYQGKLMFMMIQRKLMPNMFLSAKQHVKIICLEKKLDKLKDTALVFGSWVVYIFTLGTVNLHSA